MDNHERRFLTIKEFCEEARISRTTVYRHLKSGALPSLKVGSRVLIPSSIISEPIPRIEETAK
jgi:excisionase family DNA binding protein